jgi:elongation factor Ts
MSTISAADVNNLRKRTGAPMMDCKAALTEAHGDMEKAVEVLRTKNSKIQVKMADREAAEGRIAAYVDLEAKVGALLELRCATPSSVKSEPFVKLANDLARQIALKAPASPEELLTQPFVDAPSRTVNDRIGEAVALVREPMRPKRFVRIEGLCGSYTHHDGSVGVLLQVEGTRPDPQLLREVCMHITATNPVSARRADVPAEVVEKEREIAKAQAAATGKPPAVVDKIAEGKLNTWFAENVLEEQPFVKDASKKVGDLLKAAGLKLVRFVRYKVGELS